MTWLLGLCASAVFSGLYANESLKIPTYQKLASKRMLNNPAASAPDALLKAVPEKQIATLFGEPITAKTTITTDIGLTVKGTDIIMQTLLDRYAQEHGITVSDEEASTYAEKLEQKSKIIAAQRHAEKQRLLDQLASGTLSEQKREDALRHIKLLDQLAEHEHRRDEIPAEIRMKSMGEIAKPLIQRYKTYQQLYRDYGGRVIYQQMGSEPVDAMRDFLKGEQAKGSFVLLDPATEEAFWKYFTTTKHIYMTDEKEIDRFMNNPWWLEPLPDEDSK